MDSIKDPIKNIEEQLKKFERLNLSPIPSTKASSQKKSEELTNSLKKIVFSFDQILLNQLRLDLTQKNLKKEDNHYWTYLSKYYQIPSVKFCSISFHSYTRSKLGMIWIYITITERSFKESINEIYNQGFDKKFYDKNSLIVQKKKEILDLCNRIHLNPSIKDNSIITKDYFNYLNSLQTIKERAELNEDLDFIISPIQKQPNEKINLVSGFFLEPEKPNINTIDSIVFSRALNEDQGEKMRFDSIFLAIDNDENDANTPLETNDNIIDNRKHKKSKHNEKTPYMNIPKNPSSHFNKFANEKENYIIKKVSDFQSSYREEFYTFKEKIKKNLTMSKKKSDSHVAIEDTLKRQNDLILNPQRKIDLPLDKYFKIKSRKSRIAYTKKDSILYRDKEIKLTNSIVFYLNNYYKKEPYFRFKTKNSSLKPTSIESQNYQCALCYKQFNTILGIPTEQIYWCSYYLRFVCKNCISEDYSVIPDFILKAWSFKKFSISKQAKDLIEKWMTKPIIHIKKNDPIIKKSPKMYSALILKRKLHKIFDLMKCENSEEFITKNFGNYKYLVLRDNLFSLQDLVDIYEETFFAKLEKFFEIMKGHILKDCQTCLYKGGTCVLCKSEEKIYAFDIESVFLCNDCQQIFHKNCCTVHQCIMNR